MSTTNVSSAFSGLPEELAWLADAPLFIDAGSVARFYDAVVHPTNKQGTTTIEVSEGGSSSIEGSLGVEGTLSLKGLAAMFSGLNGQVKASASGKGAKGKTSSSKITLEVQEIETPERQLLALALHYVANQRGRLLADVVGRIADRSTAWIAAAPRALAFLQLPSLSEAQSGNGVITQLVPTAAEFGNGKVVTLFDKLRGADGKEPPPYPEKGLIEELKIKRKEYWSWFSKNYSAKQAIDVVEQCASEAGGKIRWIDYRLPTTGDGDTLHLHCSPAGEYDSGTFAYYMIKRGNEEGLRLVGTLKSGPGMNVLAVYER